MENNKEVREVEIAGEVLALKVIADSMGTTADMAALVLASLTDEDLDFVVDTLLESDDEEQVLRAADLFTKRLAELS